MLHSHLVFGSSRTFTYGIVCLQPIRNLDIQIPWFLGISLAHKHAADRLTFFYCQDITQVEDTLFPVRIPRMRTSGEFDGYMAGGKIDVEPCDDSMYEIASLNIEGEWDGECEILKSDGVEVENKDAGWVCNACFEFDSVNEWFRQSSISKRREVEAVDVVPN